MNNTSLDRNLPVQYLSSESNDDSDSSENEDYIDTPKNVVIIERQDLDKKINI